MEAEVYPTLLKALTIPDCENVSCYPVRASAAGAMMKLLDVISILEKAFLLDYFNIVLK